MTEYKLDLRKMPRKVRREVERAMKSKKPDGKRYLSGKDIIATKGLGKFMKFVPLTEEQINQMDMFLGTHFDIVENGEPPQEGESDDLSWCVVLSAITEGYVMGKAYFQEEQWREFMTAAQMFDSAWYAWKNHKQKLTANIDFIRETLADLLQMRGQLDRLECEQVLTRIQEAKREITLNMFGGRKPKSFDVDEWKYV